MRSFERSGNGRDGQSSLISRVPPWVLAFLLTGCPLAPLDFTGGTGTGTGSGGTTTTTTTTTMMTTTVGCSAPAMDCDDGNPCTLDDCQNGVCTYDNAPEGTPCGDASACNGAEKCDGKGVCVAGTPGAIDDGDVCTLDICDPKTGEVAHPASPGCGAWDATPSSGAPFARVDHTAVWTGTEMIVWGGEVAVADDPAGVTATGARYDPVAKKWTATSMTNAPAARHSHSAVWTGTKMIVWGGYGKSAYDTTGGAYDPATDTWTALSNTGVPEPRTQHRAVWTGTEMLLWGGVKGGPLSTGGRYDPVADAWTAMPAGPSARFGHSAVWTGTKMIVWGGNDLFDWHQDGKFFDPATGWTASTSVTSVPDRRQDHSAVWTGTQMVVWGGFDGGINLDSGGALDVAAAAGGVWTATTKTGAPAGRQRHIGVWTGSQMMIWGGCGGDSCFTTFADGGFWVPGADGGAWVPLADGKVTAGRISATAVWTGTEVVIWGGKAGITGKLLNTGAQSAPP
jgi:hypothetical protein